VDRNGKCVVVGRRNGCGLKVGPENDIKKGLSTDLFRRLLLDRIYISVLND
jgi:hypothetical protein